MPRCDVTFVDTLQRMDRGSKLSLLQQLGAGEGWEVVGVALRCEPSSVTNPDPNAPEPYWLHDEAATVRLLCLCRPGQRAPAVYECRCAERGRGVHCRRVRRDAVAFLLRKFPAAFGEFRPQVEEDSALHYDSRLPSGSRIVELELQSR